MSTSQERGHQALSEREQALLEVDTMDKALDEALERLIDQDRNESNNEALALSIREEDGEKIARFLETNEGRLSEEAKFFLNTVVYLRRAKDRYQKAEEKEI